MRVIDVRKMMKYVLPIFSTRLYRKGISLYTNIPSIRCLPRLICVGIPIIASVLILPACGSSESDVTPTVNSTVMRGVSATPVASPSVPNGPLITPNFPSVNGREQLTQVYDPAGASPAPTQITISTHNCGLAPAASGASYLVLAFYGAKCSHIMAIAQAFGPSAGDGKQHLYQNWICGPSSVPGYSGLCTSNGESFGLKNP